MSIAPILAASGLLAGAEFLPRVAAGFQDLLSGLTAPAAGSDTSHEARDSSQLETLLARLRKTISERLAAAGIDPAGLEFELDSVGSLRVARGGDEAIEPLLNSDPAIRSAALDLVAAAGETRIAL